MRVSVLYISAWECIAVYYVYVCDDVSVYVVMYIMYVCVPTRHPYPLAAPPRPPPYPRRFCEQQPGLGEVSWWYVGVCVRLCVCSSFNTPILVCILYVGAWVYTAVYCVCVCVNVCV